MDKRHTYSSIGSSLNSRSLDFFFRDLVNKTNINSTMTIITRNTNTTTDATIGVVRLEFEVLLDIPINKVQVLSLFKSQNLSMQLAHKF